ncbi:MAG TPA: S8 family peptidase [Candidatus Limnocylindria bacterium]|nr:S8 family peptidase [Candidatus Limnocylindria bacterium]
MAHVSHRWVSIALLSSVLAAPAWADLSKLDPRARVALAQLRIGVTQERLESGVLAANADRELDVFIVGPVSRAELAAAGARVRASVPGVCTAYIPVDAIERVAALNGVRRVEGAAPVEPELNFSVPTTNATALRGAGPAFAGWNGAGVLVGDVDSGVDYSHEDFDDAAGNTRFIGIWDQTDGIGPSPVANGTGTQGYGSDWTSADIDANVAREVDFDGHGTHVIGIAGGDGSSTGGAIPAFTYVGMAPLADLVMVKSNFQNTGVLDGVDYIFGRATALGMNAVVNLSLGSQFGPHDGTSAFESGLSAMTGPGRIIVKSAGNDRGAARHAEAFAAGAGSDVTMLVGGSQTGRFFVIDGYYESTENLSARITTPNGTVIGPIAIGNQNAAYPGTSTPNGNVYLENGLFTSPGGDPEVYVEVNVGSAAQNMNGTWTFTFIPVALGAANGEVDLWRFANASGSSANFVLGNQPTEELISEPGNAVDLITTAAYVTKAGWIDCGNRSIAYNPVVTVGTLAGFSSPGPTRDGRQKPEITAPGMGIGSTTTFDVGQVCPGGATASRLLNDGMQHVINEGTSMAAPHTSGAVALLLQRFGAVTPAFVKSHLTTNAIVDANTGAVWNKDWGNGKLRLGDLNVAVEPGVPASEVWFAVGPNPTQGSLAVQFLVAREADVSVSVFDLQGREVARLADGHHTPGRYQVGWSGAGARSGLYLVRYSGPGFSHVRRIVLTH